MQDKTETMAFAPSPTTGKDRTSENIQIDGIYALQGLYRANHIRLNAS